MAIPDYQACMLPLLRLAADGKEHQLKDVLGELACQFSLTENELREFLPSGQQPVFINRLAWARTYLNKAGLLQNPRRGFFQITPRGLEVLATGAQVNTRFLEQFPEFQEFRAGRGEVRRQDRVVTVTVPEENQAESTGTDDGALRESFHIQGALARIGEKMGFSIWLPKRDRANILKEWNPSASVLLDALPLNYDETTIRTIVTVHQP